LLGDPFRFRDGDSIRNIFCGDSAFIIFSGDIPTTFCTAVFTGDCTDPGVLGVFITIGRIRSIESSLTGGDGGRARDLSGDRPFSGDRSFSGDVCAGVPRAFSGDSCARPLLGE